MTDIPAFCTLTWDALHACEDRDDLEELEVPENGGTVFPGSAIFLLAPFLANAVNEADTDDCFELIRVLIVTANVFDTEHDEDEKSPLAKDNVDEACLFLFGIGKGLLAKNCYSIVPDDAKMKNYSVKRQAGCIQPPAGLE